MKRCPWLALALLLGSLPVPILSAQTPTEQAALSPKAEQAFAAAREAFSNQRYTVAVDWMGVVLNESPGFVDGLVLLGQAHSHLEHHQGQALSAFARAVALDGNARHAAEQLLALAKRSIDNAAVRFELISALETVLQSAADPLIQAKARIALARAFKAAGSTIRAAEVLSGLQDDDLNAETAMEAALLRTELRLDTLDHLRPDSQQGALFDDDAAIIADLSQLLTGDTTGSRASECLALLHRVGNRYRASGREDLAAAAYGSARDAGQPLAARKLLLNAEIADWSAWGDRQFDEAIRNGQPEQNKALTGGHVKALAGLRQARDAANTIPEQVQQIALRYSNAEHYEAAREVYRVLCGPDNPPPAVLLQVAQINVQEALAALQRSAAAGEPPSTEPGPAIRQAIENYAAIVATDRESEQAHALRFMLHNFIASTCGAENQPLALSVLELTKGTDPRFAAFELGWVHEFRGNEEFASQRSKYGKPENAELTAGHRNAISHWQSLIDQAADAGDVHWEDAVAGIMRIADAYANYGAHPVAEEIITGFARANERHKSLVARADQQMIEHAGLRASKEIAALKKEQVREAAAGPEAVRLVGLVAAFLEQHADSPCVQGIRSRMLGLAAEHARAGAWNAAGEVLQQFVTLRPNDRDTSAFRFGIGLCSVGQVDPTRALPALEALASQGTTAGLMTAGGRSSRGPGIGGGSIFANRGDGVGQIIEGLSENELKDQHLMFAPDQATALGVPFDMYDTLASPPPAPEPSASAVEQMALMDSRRQQAQRMALQEHSEQAPRQGHARPPAHKLSEAELTRQQAIIDQAYNSFSQVLADDPSGPFAGMARSEILLLAQHFRNLELFKNAADLLDRFCTDFPNDGQLPELVAWANTDLYEHARHSPVVPGDAYLTELVKRFDAVRARYDAFVERFADENALVASARLARAETWVKEATLAVGRSRSFASGRFQRAVREYQALAADESEAVAKFDLPAAIENIAAAMRQAEFFEESISTRTLVITHWPLRAIELRCGLVIAETYESDLNNPLAAAEVYQELLHQFPPSDSEWLTQRILDIGESLHRAKRFIEAMHVLETFVQNHPRHEQASRSLLSVGNIHAENRSWSDAIDAYLKVERDYPACPELADARWGIAECRIQQSEWSDALSAYRRFVEDHPDHPSTDEARRRQETLKDILRFEGLLADGSNGRKAADAQFQIAILVRDQLSNRIKAAAEFAELTERFGDSHLADDAQFALGEALLALEQYDRAREALARVSERFANSPLADDALFLMGRSFEEEADRLAGLTLEDAKEAIAVLGQRRAFDKAQQERAARGKAARRKLSDFRQQQDELNFDIQIASNSALENAYRFAESRQAGNEADADVARESAIAIARRQDRISAALRQSVAAYGLAAQRHPLGDQTDDALLRMARIYSDRLRDTEKAMQTYEQIVTHFSGTSVAEDAAWMIADFYQQQKRFADAVESLESFIRNYQQSTRVPDAQYRLAESLEATGRWVEAMDAYTTYVGKFPDGPRAEKAREQVTWIKAYRL